MTFHMDNKPNQETIDTTHTSNTNTHIDYNTRHKHKSPSTRTRSWLRAIAWRRQMGLLPEAHQDASGLPSLVASDVVQQKFLNSTELIDQIWSQGAIDYEAAKHLKREMFAWATMQTCLLLRIEELEADNLELESEMHRRTNSDQTMTQDNTKEPTHTDQKHKAYDTKKAERYIKPVKFTSAGYINKNNTITQTETQHQPHTPNTETEQPERPETTQTSPNEQDNLTQEMPVPKNWHTIDYGSIEHNLRLSRLDRKDTFQTAQRHVTRLCHPKGDTICFPTTEQTDRMLLRSENLPTDPKDLLDLLRQACTRRSEVLDLQSIYRDLVRAHGRVYFDPQQTGVKCFTYTKYA